MNTTPLSSHSLRLHHAPGTAAMAPHILLTEIGLPFDLVAVNTAAGEHKSPAYLALNPNGLVPVLEDGARVIFETTAIGLHLCERHPEAGLAPAPGAPERAAFLQWMVWLTNSLQATLIPWFYPERWVRPGNATGAAEVKAMVEARVGALLDLLDAELAKPVPSGVGGDRWLAGPSYTAVDAYAFMFCRWTRNFAHPARNRAHLGPYLRRVLARPAVRAVMAREGLAEPWA